MTNRPTTIILSKHFLLLRLLCVTILSGCSSPTETEEDRLHRKNQKGEYLYRKHDEFLYRTTTPELAKPDNYPWGQAMAGNHLKITKEYFRCTGSSLNPVHALRNDAGEPVRQCDCGGPESHSLPTRDKKEFVYPILVDLLNEIQSKTGHRVVITCGHRCPEHNTYADASPRNRSSKHLIGAEVDFYVQGMEYQPGSALQIILEYYKKNHRYTGKNEFQQFHRSEKGEGGLAVPGWSNQEIVVKIVQKEEGRDLDNRHPYPYLTVEVRYDRDKQQRVSFSPEAARNGYMRW